MAKKVKIFIRALPYHSHLQGEYRAGSVQFVSPVEAAELVAAGIANYADPADARAVQEAPPAAPQQPAQEVSPEADAAGAKGSKKGDRAKADGG